MSSILKRKEIPIIITSLTGVIVTLAYFIRFEPLQSTSGILTTWGSILTAAMLFIGLINVTQIHIRRINRREKQWPISVWLLIAMYGTLIVGLWAGVPWGKSNDAWVFIYTYVTTSISQTIWSLFGFYVIQASIHALRARSTEALVFLLASFVIFLWSIPVGPYIWPGFSTLGTWMTDILTGGVYRGILLGMSLGLIAFGIRVMAGIEKGYLTRRGE